MAILTVTTKKRIYPIHINNTYKDLPCALIEAGFTEYDTRAAVVTDSNVADIYLGTVMSEVGRVIKNISPFTFPAGEKSKTLDTVRSVYEFLTNKNLDRKSIVFALGGGVTGDLAGFAAATYMRGVPFVQLPTTLLSMVDSSVGGKTGVDFQGNKNYIGAFYQPLFVYINTKTLNTLPPEQFTSGLGECIKHGLIKDADYYRFITDSADLILHKDDTAIARLIKTSCEIKADIVGKDEYEQGIRAILNFGHTFGHAIESLSEFNELHGHAVAHGILGALYLSFLRGFIKEDVLVHYNLLLKRLGFPALKIDLTAEQVYEKMFSDKKAIDGKLRLVLLNDVGDAHIYDDTQKEQIIASVEYILKGAE